MLTPGQKDDFVIYMAGGTSALWALGAVPSLLAAAVLGACGIGALANRQRQAGSEPTIDEHFESQLRLQYGDDAVATYRANRASGVSPQIAARQAIYEELQRRER